MKPVKSIMVQGTGSGVGKSVIVSALCRIFKEDGFSVAPFKAQNMSLNSYVADDGGEIGRAQATQAIACSIPSSVLINPILLKPVSDRLAQVIVAGRSVGNMSVYQYQRFKAKAFKIVRDSFERLKRGRDIVVIEGAGSPAEINLKKHDLVNMKTAAFTKSPVIIVADIDKGGVFAWLYGTMALLEPDERKMVKGFIINKFRGDKRLLLPAISFLEKRTRVKVLGVVPYFNDIKLPEEDCLYEHKNTYGKDKINIQVIHLPHMSNSDDFDVLEKEPDVALSYIKRLEEFKFPDIVILPGTRNTIRDLLFLKKSGLAKVIRGYFKAARGARLVGICGGYQMLGEVIHDPDGIESKKRKINGLGMLPVVTSLKQEKVLSQVEACHSLSGIRVKGYKIHHGDTKIKRGYKHAFDISGSNKRPLKLKDGCIGKEARCWGTYIHGIFNSDEFRNDFLNGIRIDRSLPLKEKTKCLDTDKELDKLAKLVRKNVDMDLVYSIAGISNMQKG